MFPTTSCYTTVQCLKKGWEIRHLWRHNNSYVTWVTRNVESPDIRPFTAACSGQHQTKHQTSYLFGSLWGESKTGGFSLQRASNAERIFVSWVYIFGIIHTANIRNSRNRNVLTKSLYHNLPPVFRAPIRMTYWGLNKIKGILDIYNTLTIALKSITVLFLFTCCADIVCITMNMQWKWNYISMTLPSLTAGFSTFPCQLRRWRVP